WDKDERFDDRLGREKTDSYGFFEIQFTDETFRQEPLEIEHTPDLFFRVFRGRELLFSTEEEVSIGTPPVTPENEWNWSDPIERILWNWQTWDANMGFKLPEPRLTLANVNPSTKPENETAYIIQVFETWIIPDQPERKAPTPADVVPEDTWHNSVIDVLPTLDQVGLSTRQTSLTPVENKAGSLQQLIDSAFSEVLSRNPQNDPKAFLDSLTKAFTPQEINGRTTYNWTPGTYNTVQTELGGAVSGAQASLYHRAKAALNEMLPLLDKLYSLNSSADQQNMEAARSIVRTEIIELVNELGTQGGPRAQRVDSLFQLLIGDVGPDDPYEVVGGQLRELADIFGLNRSRVNTVDEEQNYGNYLIIRDYIVSLRGSWKTYSENSGSGAFVGSQLVLLSQALSVVAESVNEVYRIMDLVFLGPAERQSVWIDFRKAKYNNQQNGEFPLPDGSLYKDGLQLTPPMSIEGLLSWTMRFATQEGPALAKSGGKIGIAKSLAQTADKLMILMQAASFVPVPNTAFRRAGVIRAMKDLAFQLYQVKRLAQELIPPITSSRNIDADDARDLVRLSPQQSQGIQMNEQQIELVLERILRNRQNG
ncbi:MAG TPA: hypothetical protein DEG47_30450, partial [Cyanobacteria bacterium UBA11148]|nr:hypothetical protein [Cyanobacteria bacterium UBA11148]